MIFISEQAAQQARSLVYQNSPRKHKFPKQKYYLAQSQHQKQSHGLIAPQFEQPFSKTILIIVGEKTVSILLTDRVDEECQTWLKLKVLIKILVTTTQKRCAPINCQLILCQSAERLKLCL